MTKKRFIAPIFEHGKGEGYTGHYEGFSYMEKQDFYNILIEEFSKELLRVEKIEYSLELIEVYHKLKKSIFQGKKFRINQKTKNLPSNIAFKNLFYKKKKNKLWYSNNSLLNVVFPYKKIPFFHDFYCSELGCVIKYITRMDCYIYDENCANGNVNFIYNCKNTAINLRNFLEDQKEYNAVFFYDPVVEYDLLKDDSEEAKLNSKQLLKAQINDFFKWLKTNKIINNEANI